MKLPSLNNPPRLLHKIDFFILTYGCLAYFTKWLDQANLSNAYVSGMREDLDMYGTSYNLAVTCFQVGTPFPFPLTSCKRQLIFSRPNPRPNSRELTTHMDPAPHTSSRPRSLMGRSNDWNDVRHEQEPALSHPLPDWVLRGKLLCGRSVRAWVVVQEDGDWEANGDFRLCGVCRDDVFGLYAVGYDCWYGGQGRIGGVVSSLLILDAKGR